MCLYITPRHSGWMFRQCTGVLHETMQLDINVFRLTWHRKLTRVLLTNKSVCPILRVLHPEPSNPKVYMSYVTIAKLSGNRLKTPYCHIISHKICPAYLNCNLTYKVRALTKMFTRKINLWNSYLPRFCFHRICLTVIKYV